MPLNTVAQQASPEMDLTKGADDLIPLRRNGLTRGAGAIMTEMNVIEMNGRGAAEVMRLARRPVPTPAAGEVLIRTRAIGVNRVDILQRTGQYTPPYGITDVPGVELSGEVAALGAGVTGFSIGDAVCGLVVGGAYAAYCAVPQAQVLRLPKDYDYILGAALPEVHFTVWTALMQHGSYRGGE